MASRFDTSHRPHHARHLSHTITDGRAQEWRLIQRHPLSHRSSHEPSSQRRHLDISGRSKVLEGSHSSAAFLYLTASLILPPLLQLEECFVRGNCIKYFRVPEETVERVKEESLKRPAEVCIAPSPLSPVFPPTFAPTTLCCSCAVAPTHSCHRTMFSKCCILYLLPHPRNSACAPVVAAAVAAASLVRYLHSITHNRFKYTRVLCLASFIESHCRWWEVWQGRWYGTWWWPWRQRRWRRRSWQRCVALISLPCKSAHLY